MSKRIPFAVIYTDDAGRQVVEAKDTAQEVNDRLNELWGSWGYRGPAHHAEARGVIGSRLADFRKLKER